MGGLMWEYEEFTAKARLYFSRAEDHPRADDDAPALWLLLGLEFLLRAPLAKEHPTLLADPTGESIMHAAGFSLKPDSGAPKSIPAHTVIKRLGMVIPEFTKDQQADAILLTNMRNEELHSSSSPLATDAAAWLPHFTRVVEPVCAHLELDPDDLVGKSIMRYARSLAGEADKKLENAVRRRINEAKAFFERLKPEEIAARRAKVPNVPKDAVVFSALIGTIVNPSKPVEILVRCGCIACREEVAILRLDVVRVTNERLEDDGIYRDTVYIAESLACGVCDLQLNSTAELRVAQIQLEYVTTEQQSLEERYLGDIEPDYGND
jgi:hypothetical protein